MFFSVINKFKLGNLTKNLVTFKRWDGVKDEKFWYYGGSMKNHGEKGLAKKREWCFWGGGLITQCTPWSISWHDIYNRCISVVKSIIDMYICKPMNYSVSWLIVFIDAPFLGTLYRIVCSTSCTLISWFQNIFKLLKGCQCVDVIGRDGEFFPQKRTCFDWWNFLSPSWYIFLDFFSHFPSRHFHHWFHYYRHHLLPDFYYFPFPPL